MSGGRPGSGRIGGHRAAVDRHRPGVMLVLPIILATGALALGHLAGGCGPEHFRAAAKWEAAGAVGFYALVSELCAWRGLVGFRDI